jgi:hypothetical protein
MKPELEEILQHHGVKGMHWGKHKAKAGGVKDAIKTRVDSIKRENSWGKVLNNASNMTTKELQKHATRAQAENDLKRLSKKAGVGSAKDKKDYLNRGKMTDQELARKVQRLRAKENLNRNANDATKAQKELAKKVIQVAAPLVISYALTGTVSKKDIINTVMNPGGAKAKAIQSLVNAASKKVKHGIEDEETLQHHGVKGMHWGAHKRIQKIVKAHRAKQNQKVLDYHEKNKAKKTYKRLYDMNSKRFKTHLAAAKKTQQQIRAIQVQRAKMVVGAAGLAAPHLAPHIVKAANAVNKAAHNPDNIRKAKNVVQALKKSPIRYVDGSKMKNVVN